MFTGIVETMGTISSVIENDPETSGYSLMIKDAEQVLVDGHLGDSISVNGVCLTVTYINTSKSEFKVGISPETLRKTCLGDVKIGDQVNLERAMTATSRLGGHMVQGHVDTAIIIQSRAVDPPDSLLFTFHVPKQTQNHSDLMNYIVPKGYVCLDGVSLTVIDVDFQQRTFSITMIPFTRDRVVLPRKSIGSRVNLEVDVMGKYVENLLQPMLQPCHPFHKSMERCIESILVKKTF